MNSDHIIDVSEVNFQYEVLKYSQNIPVVVDFWATWCRPCKILEPMLEKMVAESHGAIRLARVNVDENPTLAMRYGVRSIPTVKAFSQGEVVAEFVGAQPEPRLKEFFGKITPPSSTSLAVEKADSLLQRHQWSSAEDIYREVLDQNPENNASLLGLVKSLLGQGNGQEALSILRTFPASRQFAQAETVQPLAKALVALQNDTLPDKSDLNTAFHNSIRLAKYGNIPAALDGLLDILRQDRHYENDSAREVVLSLLELMGEEDSQTSMYRSELASILF